MSLTRYCRLFSKVCTNFILPRAISKRFPLYISLSIFSVINLFLKIVILMIFSSLIYSDVACLLISLAFQISSLLNHLLISFSKVFSMVVYIFHCFMDILYIFWLLMSTWLYSLLYIFDLVKFIYAFPFDLRFMCPVIFLKEFFILFGFSSYS